MFGELFWMCWYVVFFQIVWCCVYGYVVGGQVLCDDVCVVYLVCDDDVDVEVFFDEIDLLVDQCEIWYYFWEVFCV